MSEKYSSRLEAALAEADEIERNPDRVVRDDTVLSRGRTRSRTLQIRLNDDEVGAIEAIAAARGLPVSTVARDMLLHGIDRAVSATQAPRRAFDDVIETLMHLRDLQPGGADTYSG